MGALAQNGSKVPQGAVSDKVSNLHLKKQHHMRMYECTCIQISPAGIQPVNCNINSSTCISIRTFDQSTAILIQQVHVFQFGQSTGRLQY